MEVLTEKLLKSLFVGHEMGAGYLQIGLYCPAADSPGDVQIWVRVLDVHRSVKKTVQFTPTEDAPAFEIPFAGFRPIETNKVY